ncbi:MAG: 4Fe-4S dicluster domain-containing protein [Calditrichaeota bacterium]|nr:MAG: 4Fe-4S dicluster domain-containing protein [Calditrichota bacterium]MBL1206230.1 4Fe-4S dicluster domain-containing protein [Calditrichota bacterium]NOG46056.1 4Fe-4S binding protein [Calditrichota bacterium]
MQASDKLITTKKELCRVCYTCVRDCPAKAIRISSGQAEVIQSRCIGCGNCVLVCSQNAKQYYSSIDEVNATLLSGVRTAAIIAPSFPADYPDLDYQQLCGMVRGLGFDIVSEVSFGADLVAQAYKKLVAKHDENRFIATTCPAVVSFVEKYHPELVSSLAPVASPMVVMGRVLKRIHGDDLRIVFIGPCFAKKSEITRSGEDCVIDSALTFKELNQMLDSTGINSANVQKSNFDPPLPGLGSLFPISGGMLQAGDMTEDLLTADVVCADGKSNFTHALKEFENGSLDAKLLEVLCCQGCIMGPGMSNDLPYFSRRTAVSKYARERLKSVDPDIMQNQYDTFSDIDTGNTYRPDDKRLALPSPVDLQNIMKRMGKVNDEDELDCGACGYATCREHAIAIHKGLAENEMCLPNTIDRLKKSLTDLNISNDKLSKTQVALINAEKLAGMGQLSAGIAHEINNPLGVILLNSQLMLDECKPDDDNFEDISLIVEQAERCKTIVSGLLNFARKNEVNLEIVNISALIDRCLKTIILPKNIRVIVEHKIQNPQVEIDEGQMIQVLTNLFKNAIEAMQDGGELHLKTHDKGRYFKIIVSDTGTGIPEKVKKKIFEPLFTTKKVGKGTGLGLAVAYGIIKMHRGKIDVQSNADPEKGKTGTKFSVTLPKC